MYTVLILISLFGYLDAGIIDHLKRAEGKSDIHRMRNIDFIYMINLDQRPEKFAQSFQEFSIYGIIPYRFSAVNGWELSMEVINDVGLKFKPGMKALLSTTYSLNGNGQQEHEIMKEGEKAYFCHGLFRGTIGCSLSHISILQDAWDSGYETIWVMEDDIKVIRDPRMIPDLIDRLDALVGKQNWDVLFTDQDYRSGENEYIVASGVAGRPDMDCSLKERYREKYTQKKEISPDFRLISARFGTHSMIIRRSGIRKLLDFVLEHKIYLPYDLDNYWLLDLNRYSFTYDVVSNLINALTDNAKPLYKTKN